MIRLVVILSVLAVFEHHVSSRPQNPLDIASSFVGNNKPGFNPADFLRPGQTTAAPAQESGGISKRSAQFNIADFFPAGVPTIPPAISNIIPTNIPGIKDMVPGVGGKGDSTTAPTEK
ncbi:hypothetical protein L798_04611 [Zootermopsis nevadensis]|uniref:Uncharacterized protein n=1 Tax=Zootermopsis nevadensis TaxID=136037 RepID=A0A067RC58_ZOONE|nr:hypothetical protein L798_04611 [Zootermopsis nevadensis]